MDVRALVIDAARRHGVPEDLALRVANTESAFNQGAVSPKGAIGVMQLMPGTARDLGVNPNDLRQNIDGGVRYLAQQLKTFGKPDLALAAYNAGPGAVRKYGGVPPYAETQNYVRKINGGAQVDGFDGADIFGMGGGGSAPQRGGADFDGSEIFANAAPAASPAPKPAAAPATPARPPQRAAVRTSQTIGAAEGMVRPWERTRDRFPGLNEALQSPLMATSPLAGLNAGLNFITGKLDEKAAQGFSPGRVGEFAGNVLATVPTWLVGGPATSGAASGALLSQEADLGGVVKDAAIGAVSGKVADEAARFVAPKVGAFFSKTAKAPPLKVLEAEKKAAYEALDKSGFVFQPKAISGLADEFERSIRGSALSKSAKDDALGIAKYTRGLSGERMTLSQLEKLRGDIYDAMVAKGGDSGRLGQIFRGKIDDLIDTTDNTLVRQARAANMRFKKAQTVTRASESADIRADKDYGGDYGRKLKDRLFPLIDPANPTRNLRGATPDEVAAIERIVRGTKGQNLASGIGGMLDPRRLGGKIATGLTTTSGGAGALFTGGASLLIPAAQMGTGFALTGAASRTAKKNLDGLLALIAAGGSKQALKKVPTMFGRTAQAVTVAAPVAAPAAALAATRPKRKTDQRAGSR